jgi:GNAT superfamily N-acetyltransferase
MNLKIRHALPEEANVLSQIALAANAHWGYTARWMEIWEPEMTFGREYFEQNESWVAETDAILAAFYTLQEKDGQVWLENLWVSPEFMGRGVGKHLFLHAAGLAHQRGYQTRRYLPHFHYVTKMGRFRLDIDRSCT